MTLKKLYTWWVLHKLYCHYKRNKVSQRLVLAYVHASKYFTRLNDLLDIVPTDTQRHRVTAEQVLGTWILNLAATNSKKTFLALYHQHENEFNFSKTVGETQIGRNAMHYAEYALLASCSSVALAYTLNFTCDHDYGILKRKPAPSAGNKFEVDLLIDKIDTEMSLFLMRLIGDKNNTSMLIDHIVEKNLNMKYVLTLLLDMCNTYNLPAQTQKLKYYLVAIDEEKMEKSND